VTPEPGRTGLQPGRRRADPPRVTLRPRPLAAAAVTALLALGGCTLADPAAAPVAATDDGRRLRTTAPTPAQQATTTPDPPAPAPAPTASSPAVAGTALAALAALPVKGRAPRTGYDRALFGPAWADTDRNGCDTRNDVLRRDLTSTVLDPRTSGCVVLSGTLHDTWSGRAVPFVRGERTSAEVQVDHAVALSDAWQKGAQAWTPQRRLAFANDPLGLRAVPGGLNAQKSDGDAATWLPPQRAAWCGYVAVQVAVKAKYGLWVTAAERDAITRVLQRCPDEPLPSSDHPTESDLPVWGASAPAPTAAGPTVAGPTAAAPTAGGDCDAAYPSVCIPRGGPDLDCADVPHRRFTVLAPDPHRFDGNGDGVGCESG
jgi:hypothetical protein